jgi:hypothetical protein
MMITDRAVQVVRTVRTWRRATAFVEVALAVALALGVPARAAAQPLQEEKAVRGEIAAGFMHFDYEEHANGVFLDGETGFVPSVRGSIELHRRALFLRFAAGIAGGADVDYDGFVQAFDPNTGQPDPIRDGVPAQSTSGFRYLQGEVLVGGFLDPARRVVLFGGLGRRQWDRDINPTTAIGRDGAPFAVGGLHEVYSWWDLQAGVRWTFIVTPRAEFEADFRLVRTAAPEIEIEDQVSLDLGAAFGFRGGAAARFLIAGKTFLSVALEAETYEFGRSDLVPVGGGFLIAEPDSDTQNVSLLVGFGGRF